MTPTRILNIVVVGIGGVGSALVPKLARYCAFLPDGIETRMTLVDGDNYEEKNRKRQVFHRFGNKAEVTVEDISAQFPRIAFTAVGEYLTEENIDFLLCEVDSEEGVAQDTVVLVGVDNNDTKNLIDCYARQQRNIIVICGGNDLTDGNVQVYIRHNGQDVTQSLSDVHQEIAHPADRSPHKMSCEELAALSSPQLFFANESVALLMCWVLWHVVENPAFLRSPAFAELFFDMEIGRVNSFPRQPNTPPKEVPRG